MKNYLSILLVIAVMGGGEGRGAAAKEAATDRRPRW